MGLQGVSQAPGEDTRGRNRGMSRAAVSALVLACLVQVHAPDGCTDSAASNFGPGVDTDDNSCSYTCAGLNAAFQAGQCHIYNASSAQGGWPSLAALARVGDCGGPGNDLALNGTTAASWVVQGRPASGASAAIPLATPPPELGYRLHATAGANLTLRYVRMVSGLNSTGECFLKGGYLVAQGGSVIRVEAVEFDGTLHHAALPGLGGGLVVFVWVDSSALSIASSIFRRIASNPAGGGGIYASDSRLTLNNTVLNGWPSPPTALLTIVQTRFPAASGALAPSTLLVDTSFTPMQVGTVVDNSSWLSSFTARGCQQHSCQPGHECAFKDYSIHCSGCGRLGLRLVSSDDGLTCERCQPGMEPNADHSDCQSCRPIAPDWTYSPSGLQCIACDVHSQITRSSCERCPAGYSVAANRSACVQCAAGRFSTDGVCSECAEPTVSNDLKTACGEEPFLSNLFVDSSREPPFNLYWVELAFLGPLLVHSSRQILPLELLRIGFAVLCAAGKEPSTSAREVSACQPCDREDTLFSSFGVQCTQCLSPNEVNDERTACLPKGILACDPGQQFNSNTRACENCSHGMWAGGYGECKECTEDPPNKVIQKDDAGFPRAKCALCPAGQGATADRSSCQDCANLPGQQYSNSAGACEQCAYLIKGGKCVQPEDGQVYNGPAENRTGFVSCSPGEHPNLNRTLCVKCPPRDYSKTGTTTCHPSKPLHLT